MTLHIRKRHVGNWWCCLWDQALLRRKAICVYQPLLAVVRRAALRCMTGCTLILRCSWCHQCLITNCRFWGGVNLITLLYLSFWCHHGHIDNRFKTGESHIVSQSQPFRVRRSVNLFWCLGSLEIIKSYCMIWSAGCYFFCHCALRLTGDFLAHCHEPHTISVVLTDLFTVYICIYKCFKMFEVRYSIQYINGRC